MSIKQKVSLKIRCCGVDYSPKDQETYLFFTCYKNDYSNSKEKEKVGIVKVFKTIIYELACRQHGCTKLKILKYSKGGQLLEVEDVNKSVKAVEILNKIRGTAKEITIRCPLKKTHYSKRIGLFYGYGVRKKDKYDRLINKMAQKNLDGFTKGEVFKTEFSKLKEDVKCEPVILRLKWISRDSKIS